MLSLTLLITVLGVTVAEIDHELDNLYHTLPLDEFVEHFNTQNHSYTINNYNNHKCTLPLGVLDITKASRLPIEENDLFSRFSLPEEFDSRTQWSNCPTIGEVYDQKNCGSCWTFGSATVASDRTCIHTGEVVHLSEADLQCQKADVCKGGYPAEAFEFWRDSGLVTQDCKPYDINELLKQQCTKECVNGKSYAADKHFGAKVYQVREDKDAIKAEIASKGPVEASIAVYADFELYKSGVYEHKFGPLCGYHSIRIIGYGVENGKEYWLVINSWSIRWGSKGLIKMKI
ncbi:hypothetical protein K1T71_012322 [Dendrolimus kikuchii]|uniref:Uncharacterized protein n=1 Tax=Dendrolimus kikuchii TaxID=765133 RepID=A0ACC1CL81_9NEOP|nr:hypothetical protein K1T71_012322 [Dendrolimus kikuchii]